MLEAVGGNTDEPIEKVNDPFPGRTPHSIDAAQWYRQFGTDTTYDSEKTFYVIQGQETLECQLYDGETGEYLGWLRRY